MAGGALSSTVREIYVTAHYQLYLTMFGYSLTVEHCRVQLAKHSQVNLVSTVSKLSKVSNC